MTDDGETSHSLYSLPPNTSDEDTPLIKFLLRCKQQMELLDSYPAIKVVLGNNTCDLDSAACSLCYAFVLYCEDRRSAMSTNKPILPVFNIKREELKYKTEVCYVLEKLHIPEELLMFRDTVDLEGLASEQKLEMVLVDHHTMSKNDKEAFEHSLVQIIDHRPMVKYWPIAKALCTVRQVGSCCTLVAQKIQEREPSILRYDPQIPQMLYCGIVLDTMNFSEVSKRYAPEDLEMLQLLEQHVLKEGQTREQVYQGLLAARTSVEDFTGYEILLKDVKYAYGVPVCTLPSLVQEFVTREDAEESLKKLMEVGDYELIILIGITLEDDVLMRDIGLYHGPDNELCVKVLEAIKNDPSLNLCLEEVPYSAIENLVVFQQHNREKTRKHMMPVIEATVTSLRKKSDYHLTP